MRSAQRITPKPALLFMPRFYPYEGHPQDTTFSTFIGLQISSFAMNACVLRIAMWRVSLCLLLGLSALPGARAANIELNIDFSQINGQMRALHGINRGPLVGGGMLDLTDA